MAIVTKIIRKGKKHTRVELDNERTELIPTSVSIAIGANTNDLKVNTKIPSTQYEDSVSEHLVEDIELIKSGKSLQKNKIVKMLKDKFQLYGFTHFLLDSYIEVIMEYFRDKLYEQGPPDWSKYRDTISKVRSIYELSLKNTEIPYEGKERMWRVLYAHAHGVSPIKKTLF